MSAVETFLVTVAAALVGALAVMAVRTPAQYERLSPYLTALAFGTFLFLGAYLMGGKAVAAASREFIEGGKAVAASHAQDAVLPDFNLWMLFGAGSVLYLQGLRLLPTIIERDEDETDS